MEIDPTKFLSIGQTALMVGCLESRLRKLCDKGLIPHCRMFGNRVISSDDLDKVRAACAQAGYLKAPAEAAITNG